ncbi:MAG: SGNH/GDSL hydrolase family protein [Candidatus Nanopelagicales bacterium]
MTRADRARRIAARAAFGGGGLAAAGAGLFGVLVAEAALARRWVGPIDQEPFDADGVYGTGHGGIRLAVLGDSSAAGLGVDEPFQTPGAVIATGLAEISGRPVELLSVAVVGAETSGLEAQLELVLPFAPDLALIMIGANDVTHRVKQAVSVRLLGEAIDRLREHGAEVVVATCPDLGTVEPVKHPLRMVARRLSRQLAAAQAIAVVEAGGTAVSLGDILGPEFSKSPNELFSSDRFHPSAFGYRRCAEVLLPSVCASLGYALPEEEQPDIRRGEAVLPVSVAAAEAADQAGTEVAAVDVAGQHRGPRGRWAALRHRRRREPVTTETLEPAESAEPAETSPPSQDQPQLP